MLFTRHGAPDTIVLPVDDRVEGLALTRSDAFLADIDRAEKQIKDGMMVPLEDAVQRLGFGDAESTQATIKVGAPITDVMTLWFPKGSDVEFTGSYLDGVLIAAKAFDRDGSLLMLHGKTVEPGVTTAVRSQFVSGLSVSLQRTGRRSTEISVSAPTVGATSSPGMHGAVIRALGAVKADVEGSSPGSWRRGPLAFLPRLR